MARGAQVTREDVIKALKDLDGEFQSQYTRGSKFQLLFNGKSYPPKAVLSRASFHSTGTELPLKSFSGGESTNKVLRALGFEIVSNA